MGKEDKKRKRESITEAAAVDVAVEAASAPVDPKPAAPTTNDAEPEAKRQTQRRSVFIRGLAADTTTDSLIEHFSSEYPIKHGHAVIDPATKTCKGYGFVAFADADDARRAIAELDGSDLLGRRIRLEIAEPRKRELDDSLPGELRQQRTNATAAQLKEKRKAAQAVPDVQARPPKLIVRNLPWSIKEPDQLAKLFMSYGKVKFATLPKKGANTLAGFGFVMLRGQKNAETAIKGVNGKEVDGRKLAVDWAVEKQVWDNLNKAEGADAAEAETDDVAEVQAPVDSDEEMEDGPDEDAAENSDDFEDIASDDEDAEDEDTEIKTHGDADNDEEDKSTTVFIRNVPFTTSDDDLFQHFRRLAPVRYARIVMDPTTERPRGTGFVCFRTPEDTKRILSEAPRETNAPAMEKKAKEGKAGKPAHSILQDEASDPTGAYTLDGRILSLAPAVTKSTATSLSEASHKRRQNDKRRLYLLHEGTIAAGSALHAQLAPSEAAMRDASLSQRKKLLEKNPTLHLSLTRLSIRNLPRSITTADLKALARSAVVGFATDVKEGTRTRLSKEELSRAADEMAEAERARKRSGKGIVRQAKIVFEADGGSKVEERAGGRSRGYGFVEYHTHRAALMGLRWLNGRAADPEGDKEAGERRKRLIVEFAIENAQVVMRRDEREKRAREPAAADGARPFRNGKTAKDTPGKQTRAGRAADAKGKAATKKSKAEAPAPPKTEEEEKLARRQRIIARKRSVRRDRKKGGKA